MAARCRSGGHSPTGTPWLIFRARSFAAATRSPASAAVAASVGCSSSSAMMAPTPAVTPPPPNQGPCSADGRSSRWPARTLERNDPLSGPAIDEHRTVPDAVSTSDLELAYEVSGPADGQPV